MIFNKIQVTVCFIFITIIFFYQETFYSAAKVALGYVVAATNFRKKQYVRFNFLFVAIC